MGVILAVLLSWTAFGEDEKPEIIIQTPHYNYVSDACFSKDGNTVLTGTLMENSVKLWDLSSGRVIRTYTGVSDGFRPEIQSVKYSDDEKYVIASFSKIIKIWDISSGKEVRTLSGHKGVIYSLDISSNGKYIVSGSEDKTIALWNIGSGKNIRTLSGHKAPVKIVSFSPDGKKIASGSDDATVKIWETETGFCSKTLKGHSNKINSLSFLPDGKSLITCSSDNTIKLWDIESGTEINTFPINAHRIAVTPDGVKFIASMGDDSIRIFDITSGKELKKYKGRKDYITSLSISADGKKILSSSYDYTVKIQDVETGTETMSLISYRRNIIDVVYSAICSSDGKHAINGKSDGSIILWDIENGKQSYTVNGHTSSVYSISLTPDGKYTLSGSQDKTIKIWNTVNGKEIQSLNGHKDRVWFVSYSPDGRYFITISWDRIMKLWDSASGNELKTFTGHNGIISSAVFSPDCKTIISGSEDKTIKIWDIASGKEIKSISVNDLEIEDLKIFQDGKKVVVGGVKGKLGIWDLVTGAKLKSFSGHNQTIYSVSISPDNKTIISGSFDYSIKLWDVSSGKNLKTFKGHTAVVTSVTFSADGKFIISGSYDGTMRMWDINTGKEIAQFISFNDKEWAIITPEGYFNASKNGSKYINVIQGMKAYSIDNFFETYFRPDIVNAKIKGEDITKYVKESIKDGIKNPPILSLSIKTTDGNFGIIDESIKNNYFIESGIIKVRVTAKDNGGGIKGIRLFNNGKAVGENMRGLKNTLLQKENSLVVDFDVSLADGENILKAVGFSDDMTESNPVVTVISYASPKIDKPDMYIFAVGINQYKNGKYNLNYCLDDAKGFIDTLTPKAKKIFGNVFVTQVNDRDATRANITKTFDELKTKIKTSDVFTFFYAGHGIALDVTDENDKQKSEFFYVLSDVTQMTDNVRCSTEGISGTEMRKILSDIKAAKQIMFVDACNSGAFANQFALRGAAEENALAKLSRATGSVIFASTTKEQFASEFKELKHGIFTYVLIEGINGSAAIQNGQITAASIKASIDDKIPEYSKKYKGEEQYPTTFIWGQDFPIGMK